MSGSAETDALLAQAKDSYEHRRYVEAEVSLKKALGLLDRAESDSVKFAWALETLAGVHFIQGKFELAASEYQEVFELREKQAIKDVQAIWRVLYWLGLSHFNHPNYDKAEASFRQALAVAEGLNDYSANLATSLYQLGFHLYFVGKYREAEPYLLRALPLHERVK